MDYDDDGNEIDPVLGARKLDPDYARIKPFVDVVLDSAKRLEDQLLQILLEDLAGDLAFANAIKKISFTVEHVIQEKEVDADRPQFNGDDMKDNFSRISQLSTIVKLARTLRVEESLIEQMIPAEIARIWFDKERMRSVATSEGMELKIPKEITGLLKLIAKGVAAQRSSIKRGTNESK